jgi:hypothetical protein
VGFNGSAQSIAKQIKQHQMAQELFMKKTIIFGFLKRHPASAWKYSKHSSQNRATAIQRTFLAHTNLHSSLNLCV